MAFQTKSKGHNNHCVTVVSENCTKARRPMQHAYKAASRESQRIASQLTMGDQPPFKNNQRENCPPTIFPKSIDPHNILRPHSPSAPPHLRQAR